MVHFRRSKASLLLVVLLALAAGGHEVVAQAPPTSSPIVTRVHPRLFITPSTVPAMRTKLSGDFAVEFQRFVQSMDSVAPKVVADSATWRAATVNFAYILDFAFLYQIDPATVPGATPARSRAQYGDIARQLLLQAVTSKVTSYLVPVAYDWLYDVLSPAERTTVAQYILTYRTPSASENPFDDQAAAGRENWVMTGLALYGDLTAVGEPNAANGEASRRVADYARYIEGSGTSNVTAGNFIAGTDGGWSQGLNYASVDATLAPLRVMEARRTAFGLSRSEVFKTASLYRYYPRWVAALLLPQGKGLVWRTQASDAGAVIGQYSGLSHNLSILRLYKNIDDNTAGLAQWLLDATGSNITPSDTGAMRFYLFGHFIFGERVIPKTPYEAGLASSTRFSSYGSVFMRTNWTGEWVDPGDTFVGFDAATWARGTTYWQWANPSFTIDRHGPLLVHSGTLGHQDYAHRAWSGNTVVFPDPNESNTSPYFDRGGQRFGYTGVTTIDAMLPGSVYDVGGINRSLLFDPADPNRDFDYIDADATRAYNGPYLSERFNTSKVARYTRQFVYFRGSGPDQTDRIVVFDRTQTTGTQFEKRWTFHPSRKPVVGGTEVPNSPVRGGSGDGKTTYTGAGNGTMSVVNNLDGSSGQMWVTSLLPASRSVVVVGGPNTSGAWGLPLKAGDLPSHEFEDPYGVQNPNRNNYTAAQTQYVGQYRVEIIPTTPSLDNDFLNVFEAGDLTDTKSATAYLSGTNYRGVRVGDRIAVFATTAAVEYNGRDERPIASGDFVIDRAGAYRVLIADLSPSVRYEVTIDGASQQYTPSAAGTLYLPVAAGTNTRVAVRALQAVPALPPPPVAAVQPVLTAPAAPKNLRIGVK